jgi:hypothetical protein
MSAVTACRQQKGQRYGPERTAFREASRSRRIRARYAEVAAVRRLTAVIVVLIDQSLSFPIIVL